MRFRTGILNPKVTLGNNFKHLASDYFLSRCGKAIFVINSCNEIGNHRVNRSSNGWNVLTIAYAVIYFIIE